MHFNSDIYGTGQFEFTRNIQIYVGSSFGVAIESFGHDQFLFGLFRLSPWFIIIT